MRKPDSRRNGKRQEGPHRKYATWGEIGLAEYNPNAAKWECRVEHSQREMITAGLTHLARYRRDKEHSEQIHGGGGKPKTK